VRALRLQCPSLQGLSFITSAPTHVPLSLLERVAHESIIYLSFPPRKTHLLQPIDVSSARSFKTFFTKLSHSWSEMTFEVC
jgi:hypothetical protein